MKTAVTQLESYFIMFGYLMFKKIIVFSLVINLLYRFRIIALLLTLIIIIQPDIMLLFYQG